MDRVIRKASRHSRNEAKSLLQSIFAAELVCPSEVLWIASPWISDVPLIDNRATGFTVEPSWGPGDIALSRVLGAVASRGGFIRVITTRDRSNEHFLRRLDDVRASEGIGDKIRVTFHDDERLHEKGIVGDDFAIDGSMNLTFMGVAVRKERVNFTTEVGKVARLRLEMNNEFGGRP